MTDLKMRSVSGIEFLQALLNARKQSNKVREATSPVHEVSESTSQDDNFYLGLGGLCGLIIKADGELISVFSLVKGQGNDLLSFAIESGAVKLDCFDGYLTEFYKKHGFVSYKIVPNWTQGEPSVHFMRLFA